MVVWPILKKGIPTFFFMKGTPWKKASIRNVINYSWERWLTHTIGSCPISLLTPRSLKSLIKQTEAASALLDVEPLMSQLTTMRQHSNFIGVKLKWASFLKMWKSKFSNFLAQNLLQEYQFCAKIWKENFKWLGWKSYWLVNCFTLMNHNIWTSF